MLVAVVVGSKQSRTEGHHEQGHEGKPDMAARHLCVQNLNTGCWLPELDYVYGHGTI